MDEDLEAMELRDLAEEKRYLRFEETRRELAERRRDEEMRRHEALEEAADAIHVRLDAVERVVLRLILWFFCAIAIVIVATEAVRLFV